MTRWIFAAQAPAILRAGCARGGAASCAASSWFWPARQVQYDDLLLLWHLSLEASRNTVRQHKRLHSKPPLTSHDVDSCDRGGDRAWVRGAAGLLCPVGAGGNGGEVLAASFRRSFELQREAGARSSTSTRAAWVPVWGSAVAKGGEGWGVPAFQRALLVGSVFHQLRSWGLGFPTATDKPPDSVRCGWV